MAPVDDLRSGTWVTYVGGRATGARLRRCRIEVTAGPDAGLIRDVEAPVIRVGARRGNDVQLTDSKVSGLHCEIRLDERGYRLRDLDSTNGTFVSGMRIVDLYIQPGTVFAVGASRMKFEPLGEMVDVELAEVDRFGDMIGRSVKMRELFARLGKLAASDTTVLVTGETGTGKELVAEALHEQSPRAAGPFVVLDCGSIPANLIESELFGHERGAYTGADSRVIGKVEAAAGGTLFLDEVGELPIELQGKFLRFVQERRFERVGGRETLTADVRIVAATNRDLPAMAAAGTFRSDLYYRLRVVEVELPPLRERGGDDVLALAEHFADQYARKYRRGPVRFADRARTLIAAHTWPGNVRELEHAVERAVVLSRDGELDADELGLIRPAGARRTTGGIPIVRLEPPGPGPAESGPAPAVGDDGVHLPPDLALDEAERRYALAILTRCGGNQSAAARQLGISRNKLARLLRER